MEFHWRDERNQISLVAWAHITLCIQTQFTSVGGLYDILVMKQQCHLTWNATKYPLLSNIIFTHFNSVLIVIRDYFPFSFTKVSSLLVLWIWPPTCEDDYLSLESSFDSIHVSATCWTVFSPHPSLPFCSVYLFCFSLLCEKPPPGTPHHSELCLLLPCSKQGNQHHGQSRRADCSVWLRLHALCITGAHDVWGMNTDLKEVGLYLLVT